ncbi:siderophore-interacting protein [Amycolatopsis aidingensis]|uniref:siderophore-interacting protein n=1 Tax=Amycolatopsis aidingensis TaxID=2842453 RepID=UPI001C0C65DA|nr:siderophore-interacting protein [Amycolatopsis aidingensis]
MARTNLRATRVKPEHAELLTLHVVRREQITPHFARVTLGGGDIARFSFMGFDQWFRLFIPVAEDSLSRLPSKLDTLSYARYLSISKAVRPVLRNYSVRAYREGGADGPEIDVDFVLHGSAAEDAAGPAATWARTCSPGDPVGLLDEGIGFNPDPALTRFLLVADESGLPATAGILAALPADATGQALIEVPSEEDRQDLTGPAGVAVEWIVRTGHDQVPGRAALAAATELGVPAQPCYGWVVGEQTLPSTVRRNWVRAGVPKENIMFCGYWRAGR